MRKTATKISFQAKLQRPAEGGSWMFLRLPQDASDQLPTRNATSVEGTINGVGFQVCLQQDGEGGHWLKVDPDLAATAGIKLGDNVDLEVAQMAVELEPEVPSDLQAALEEHAGAFATWTDISPTARRDWILWLTTGKKAETRLIRMTKMMDMLSKGKRRICCFDRSGKYSNDFSCPAAADD